MYVDRRKHTLIYRRIKEEDDNMFSNYAKPVRAVCQITSDCPKYVDN